MTASHCTDALASEGIAPDEVFVTFGPTFDASSQLYSGTAHTHPKFGFSGRGGMSDPHDIAVIVLEQAVEGITPARLPAEGLLNTLDLRRQSFTAVGYGAVRDSKGGGPAGLKDNLVRMYAPQSFNSLTAAWLNLSMQPSTGNGGTCYGDSGGPHLLGDTSTVVSLTVTGDAMCRATDKTYRVDTPSARAFLITTAEDRFDDFKRRMDAQPRRPPRAAGHDAP